jgi:voltage-gated potassium channel
MTEPEKRRLRELAHPQSLFERRMSKFLREPPSVRLAANVIVTATAVVVVIGGVVIRVLDHKEYSSVWIGMWWILETITTVGYGDYTPKQIAGRLVSAAVMLWGVAFLAIITAAITSVFVARAQRERALGQAEEEAPVMAGLLRVDNQLADLTAHSKQVDEQLQRLTDLLERTQPKG